MAAENEHAGREIVAIRRAVGESRTLAAGDQKLGQRKGDDQGSLQLAVA